MLSVGVGVGSTVERLESLAHPACAGAGRLGRSAAVAVRLALPAAPGARGAAPVLEEVEVFGNLLAEQCERLQSRLRQGPRVLADRGRCAVLVPDLRCEQRWPVFRSTAGFRHGLAAVHVEPLSWRGGPALGTLAWYPYRAAGFCHAGAVAARREYAATLTVQLLAVLRSGPAQSA